MLDGVQYPETGSGSAGILFAEDGPMLSTLLIISLACPQAAQDPDAPERIKALEARIAVATLLDKMAPSKEQLPRIQAVVEAAQAEREKYEADLLKIREEELAAFEEFKKEDEANQGFSPKVERRAAKAEHEEKELRKAFFDRINGFEARLAKELTPEQAEVLKAAGLSMDLVADLFRRQGPPPMPPEVDRAVREIRRTPAADFAAREDELRRQLVRALGMTPNAGDLIKRAREAMTALRELGDDEVAEKAPRILEKMKPPSELDQVRSELAELHKEKYGSIGGPGRFLIHPATREVLKKRLGPANPVPTERK